MPSRNQLIATLPAETRKLFRAADKAIHECLFVSNDWLPEEMHDKVRGGRTLARLNKIADKRDGLTEHQKLKAIKAENIKRLAAQVQGTDIDKPLDYSMNETNDTQLSKNMIAMVNGMVSSGMIEADDLNEE
jgi:hypothetical protein